MLNTESFKQEGGYREWGDNWSRGKLTNIKSVCKSHMETSYIVKTYQRNLKGRYLTQRDNTVPIEVDSYTKFQSQM